MGKGQGYKATDRRGARHRLQSRSLSLGKLGADHVPIAKAASRRAGFLDRERGSWQICRYRLACDGLNELDEMDEMASDVGHFLES